MDGEYDVNGLKLIVSRGAGTQGPRMRLWRPAPILRIPLRSPRQAPVRGSEAPGSPEDLRRCSS